MKQILVYIPPIKNSIKFQSSSKFEHQEFGNKYWCNIIEEFEDYLLVEISNFRICITSKPIEYFDTFDDIIEVSNLNDYKVNKLKIEKTGWFKQSLRLENFSAILEKQEKKLEIVKSWENSFYFKIAENDTDLGLRKPQIGALHAIHSYFTTNKSKIQTVVLPTGTGKTETMLSVVVSKKVGTTLVVVPSDALRTQIADKFIKLGILREATVIRQNCLNPIVYTLSNIPKSKEEIKSIFAKANVVVTTIHSIGRVEKDLQEEISKYCDLIIYDEAHHEAATTWRKLSNSFSNNNILQFTATPYRNDKKELQGQIVYNYSLKNAQEDGYFSKINFESICIFDTNKADKIISEKSVLRLREDLAKGLDHLLMARTSKIERAEEVFEFYKEHKDLNPILINSNESNIQKIKDQIIQGKHKIIICVNMLGEGFDLPQLKIAALHDNHKSLPVFLQFIGRFARSKKDLGEAYVIANIDNEKISDELEEIWNSTDWNSILKRISSEKIDTKIDFQKFLEEYNAINQDFPLQSLKPTLSTLVYDLRNTETYWNTNGLEKNLQGKIVYSTDNYAKKTLICITEIESGFDWIENDSVVSKTYNLYIFHYDEELKLLFVSGSGDKSELKKAVKSLCCESPKIISGETIFRCFYGVYRVKLTNIGLYTILQNGRSYMQYLGSSVSDSLTDIERLRKSKANFFGNGYEGGKKISIGCSVKGRIWSFSHDNLLNYTLWCNNIGKKLVNESITFDDFLNGFLIPEKVTERPNVVPISIDWHGESFNNSEQNKTVVGGTTNCRLYELELELINHDISSKLSFNLIHEEEVIATFIQDFENDEVIYSQTSGVKIYINSQEITNYFEENNPRIWFENFNYLEGNQYYSIQNQQNRIFSNDNIKTFDWLSLGTDITKESQGFKDINESSIQFQTIKLIESGYDLIFNDDNSGEIADIIGIKVRDKHIEIDLYHCKFSKSKTPSSKINDFYEVCGQTQKSIRKIENKESFFNQLKRRENNKQKKSQTRIIKGDYKLLNKIQGQSKLLPIEYKIYIVQPGLSLNKLNDDTRVLLGNTELFLNETMGISLTIFCSH